MSEGRPPPWEQKSLASMVYLCSWEPLSSHFPFSPFWDALCNWGWWRAFKHLEAEGQRQGKETCSSASSQVSQSSSHFFLPAAFRCCLRTTVRAISTLTYFQAPWCYPILPGELARGSYGLHVCEGSRPHMSRPQQAEPGSSSQPQEIPTKILRTHLGFPKLGGTLLGSLL